MCLLSLLTNIGISLSAMDNEKELLISKGTLSNDDSEIINIEAFEKVKGENQTKESNIPDLQQICVDHIVQNPDKIYEIYDLEELDIEIFGYNNAKKIACGLQKERVRIKKALSQQNNAKNNAKKLKNNSKHLPHDFQKNVTNLVNTFKQALSRDKKRLEGINKLIVHFKSFIDRHEEEIAVTRYQKMKFWLSRNKKGVCSVVGIQTAIYTVWWILLAFSIKYIRVKHNNLTRKHFHYDDNAFAAIGCAFLPTFLVFHSILTLLRSETHGESFYQLATSHKGVAVFLWLLPIILTGSIIMPAILLS